MSHRVRNGACLRGYTHAEPHGDVRPCVDGAIHKCHGCGCTLKTMLDLEMHFCVPTSLRQDRSIDEDGAPYRLTRR